MLYVAANIFTRCCIFVFIVLADSAIMAYTWTPWWVQFREYAGKLIAPDVRPLLKFAESKSFVFLLIYFNYDDTTV